LLPSLRRASLRAQLFWRGRLSSRELSSQPAPSLPLLLALASSFSRELSLPALRAQPTVRAKMSAKHETVRVQGRARLSLATQLPAAVTPCVLADAPRPAE